MRVLFWSDTFWPAIGGSEITGTTLLRALRRRGHEFLVVTRHDDPAQPDQEMFENIAIHRFPVGQALVARHGEGLIAMRQRLAALKRAFEPELVHVHYPGDSLYLHRLTAAVRPAPVLVALHIVMPPARHPPGSVIALTLRDADWLVACSRYLLEETRRDLPEVSARSSYIYYGLPDPTEANGRPPDAGAPLLLCVGRVEPQKGFDLAVAALPRIADRFPGARLTIAGDGSAMPALATQAAALGMAAKVDRLGWVDPARVPDLMGRAAVVLVPSRPPEAFGLVAVQAGQMARPVVAARVGGLPEIVDHGRTGFLVPPESPEAIADAVTALLADTGRAAAFGRSGRERVRRLFDAERCAGRFEQVYERLALQPDRAARSVEVRS